MRHLQEKTARVLETAGFAISGQNGVPGKDVFVRNVVEHVAGRGNVVAFGIEFDEVVGEKGVGEKGETEESSVNNLAG